MSPNDERWLTALEALLATGRDGELEERVATAGDRSRATRCLGRAILALAYGDIEGLRTHLDAAVEVDEALNSAPRVLCYHAAASLAEGDAATAESLVDQALAQDPERGDAWEIRAQASLAMGDRDEAARALHRALSGSTPRPSAHLGLARLEAQRGRLAAVIGHLSEAFYGDTRHDRSADLAASVFATLASSVGVLTLARATLSGHHTNVVRLALLALVTQQVAALSERIGADAGAARIGADALEAAASEAVGASPGVRHIIAQLLIDAGVPDRAMSLLSHAAPPHDPDDAARRLEVLGRLASTRQDTTAALAHFREAVAATDDPLTTLAARANGLRVGSEAAIETLREVIAELYDTAPRWLLEGAPSFALNAAIALARVGRADEASRLLGVAARSSDGRVCAYASKIAAELGLAPTAAGVSDDDAEGPSTDAPESVEAFMDAFTRAASLGGLELARAFVADAARTPLYDAIGAGLIAVEEGALDSAIAAFERALAIAADEASITGALALAHAQRGEAGAAVDAAKRALAADESAATWSAYGHVLLLLERPQDARRAFTSAVDLDETWAPAQNGLGRAEWLIGNQPAALRRFARAFELAPRDATILQRLGRMYAQESAPIAALAGMDIERTKLELELPARVFYDLAMLGAAAAADHIAWYDASATVGDILERLRSDVEGLSPERRATVALRLHQLGRHGLAERLVDTLDADALAPEVRAIVAYLRGGAAARRADYAEALACYTHAVDLSPDRWDACCDALELLTQSPAPEATAQMGRLLGAIPSGLRATRPPLVLNEALYRQRDGDESSAAAAFATLADALPSRHPIGARAREHLAAIEH